MSNRERDREFCFFRDLPGNNCEELEEKYGCPDLCPEYEDPEMEAERDRQSDPFHLKTLHPGMWKNIQFLRRLADELEFNNRFNWHDGKRVTRQVKGRKYRKFTGEIELVIWLYDSEIAGKPADDSAPDWPEWWV